MMLLAGTNLACNRAGLPIFKAVSFEVGAGTALLVTGPNGSGKTSLLRLIAGLIHPAEGQVVLEGADPDTSAGEQAHYLAHQDALKPSLTVTENLRFWADFLGGQAPPEAALKAVRLESLATLPAAYLSAGQRRRLSLARLLAVPRPLWLLDEPTAALDGAGQATLIEMMRDHLAGGGIIVAATHGPLGLEGAQELRLGGARPPSEEMQGTSAPGPTHPLEGGMGRSTSLGFGKECKPTAMPQSLSAILTRDMKIAVRNGGGALMGVLFFLAVVTLIPFALGPDLALLRRVGPAVLWLGALLASLLALDRLLAADQEDGSLDLILNGPAPLELVVGAKAVAHWLTTGLPLVLASPLFGVMLNLPPAALGAVMLTLLVGTPALTLIGLIGAALAVALRRGGILLPVLVLPLAIPVLIFGVAAANAALGGLLSFGTPFTILCALSLISLVVGPFAAAATLRHIE
jgi:heme exporter protein B